MGRLSSELAKMRRPHMLLTSLPDIFLAIFFAFSAVLAINEWVIGEFLAEELSLWFVYEFVGAFFLLLWVALNEERKPSRKLDLFRFLSTCTVYSVFALLMYFVFHASLSCVIISAVGGIWALLNPLLREDEPSVFQIGREAALTVLGLTVSFFAVAFLASIAEQTLPRPFHRTTFEAVTVTVMGVFYYLLRWRLVAYLASRGTEG